MLTVTPEAFLERLDFCLAFRCADHHFSGPPTAQQTENQGSVFHIEGRILAALAARLGGPVLEIGADLGISTRYIHEGLDRWEENQNALALTVGGSDVPSPSIYSVDVLHKWDDDPSWPRRIRLAADSSTYQPPEPCAWAFIDGDHRYAGVLADCRTARDADIPYLIFHDTAERFPAATGPSTGSDARRAVLDFFTPLPDWKLLDISSPCGLIFAYRHA